MVNLLERTRVYKSELDWLADRARWDVAGWTPVDIHVERTANRLLCMVVPPWVRGRLWPRLGLRWTAIYSRNVREVCAGYPREFTR